VLFDNRITQHYAIDNDDIPTGVDGDGSYSLKGDASEYSEVVQVSVAA
jgi:hypothetical protein